MKASKVERLPIADLKMNLFVRSRLDQDHALMLAQLIAEGVKLPPIQVNEAWIVIDGRHRIEGHQINDLTEIDAEVVDIKDEAELIAAAYKANTGGPLPPTAKDSEHTVMLLLDRGVAKKRIGEMLGLPPGIARSFVDNVQAKLARSKMQRAVSAVAEDSMTVEQAAATHGVDTQHLRETLSGKRRQKLDGMEILREKITRANKSMGQTVVATLRKLDEKLEDGDMTERQVLSIVKQLEKSHQSTGRALADWQRRFETKKGAART